MWTSAANFFRQVERFEAKAINETVHFDNNSLHLDGVLGNVCDAALHRANIELIRDSDGCECDDINARHVGSRSQRFPFDAGQSVWQTQTLLIFHCGIVCQLLWIELVNINVSWKKSFYALSRGRCLPGFVFKYFFCFPTGIYGYNFFPSGWSSFEKYSNVTNSEYMQEIVGNWNYFALAMFLIMQFCISLGVSSIPMVCLKYSK